MPDFRIAAFRTASYSVTADGSEYTFRHAWAREWLEALGSDHWPLPVVTSLTDSESYQRLCDELCEDRTPKEYIPRLARAALAEAAGRPWWEAERLAGMALHPGFLGHLLMRGADPGSMTLAAFLALVQSTVMQAQDRMGQMKFEAEIAAPPPGAEDEVPEEDVAATVERMRAIAGVRVG